MDRTMSKQKLAVFQFELQDGSPLKLYYRLNNTSLRDRWIKQVMDRNAEPNTFLDLKISNKTTKDIPHLINKINEVITGINLYYDKQLPLFTETTKLDHEILNYLHEEFEVYGERHEQIIIKEKRHLTNPGDPKVWPGNRFNVEFHNLWLKLNEYIHIIESAISTSKYGEFFLNFSCLVNVYPPVPGELIQEIDKLFLDTNFKWGELYLGYNTLGKDYQHAWHDDDTRVITNGQVKVQEYFSTEAWLNFTEGAISPNTAETEFWKWYERQDQSVKDKIPLDNLNKLALGRYHIGSIVYIELSEKYDYREWINNPQFRYKWNVEVFSQVERAVKVDIIEIEEDDENITRIY
jgi:uncharacterized HAD superfamily protein